MSRAMGSRSVVSAGDIARRQVAVRYGKPRINPTIVAARHIFSGGPTTWQPGVAGLALVFAVAPGGGGQSTGNGGGGGAALYAAIPLSGAETFTVNQQGGPTSAATDGQDTTIAVGSRTMTVGGGKASGQGGTAIGGDSNRTGGAGGSNFSSAGTAGQNGAAGGVAVGNGGGGGGAAGFNDFGLGDLLGSNPFSFFYTPSAGGAGATTGGGSGSAAGSSGSVGGGGGGANGGTGGMGSAGDVCIVVIGGVFQ
jgi:hypothetical protein